MTFTPRFKPGDGPPLEAEGHYDPTEGWVAGPPVEAEGGGEAHRNTDHDEAYNRAHWHGEEWLGIESLRAPAHGAPRRITGGTYAADGRKAGYTRNARGQS